MYKFFISTFVFIAFYLLAIFPQSVYAQSCGGGNYYCMDFTEYCTLPSGGECFPWQNLPGCNCSVSCLGQAGQANSCSGASSEAICNILDQYVCRETPCGTWSGSCSWNPGGGGGGGGPTPPPVVNECTVDSQCGSTSRCCAAGTGNFCSNSCYDCAGNYICATACPGGTLSDGSTNACLSGSSCPAGTTPYGSLTNNACGAGQVCCNTPPAPCPGSCNTATSHTNYVGPCTPPGGGNGVWFNQSQNDAYCAQGGFAGNYCWVCIPSGSTPAPIPTSTPVPGCSNVGSACGTGCCSPYTCNVVTNTCTNPAGPTSAPTSAPTAPPSCSSGLTCTTNGNCPGSMYCSSGCCVQPPPVEPTATLAPDTSQIGVFEDINGNNTYQQGIDQPLPNGLSVRFLMSNTPNQQPDINGMWTFPSSSYSYFSVQTNTIPAGYREAARIGSTTVSPNSSFILLLEKIPPVVTIQGRIYDANNQQLDGTPPQITGQGVSVTGLGSKTNTPWDYSQIPTGTYTLSFNQVVGYKTRYRCNGGNCGAIPTTYTDTPASNQVNISLPNPGNYIDVYVQYVVVPACASLTKNARSGNGGVAASGSVNAGTTLNLFANIINDDGNHTNSSWSASCGTFTSTNWDYATYTAPSSAGSCTLTYTLNGVAQPACSANLTVNSVCSVPTASQTVSGRVYVDTAGNGCASGATPYSVATLPTFTLRNGSTVKSGPVTYNTTSVPGYTLTDATSCSSEAITVTMSGLPSAYGITGYRLASSGSFTSHSGTQVILPSSSSTPLDWCVSTASSWFQTDSGDVRYSSLVNRVPAGNVGSVSTLFPTPAPGIYFSSDSSISTSTFGQGSASSQNWKVADEYDYNDDFRNGLGSMSYTFYNSQTRRKELSTTTISTASHTFGDGSLSAIYKKTGDLTINAATINASDKHIVVLVDGNVTIGGPIFIAPGQRNLFVVAAKGNITIDPSIGETTLTSSTPNLSGYYTAEGSIIMPSTANCGSNVPDRRLNVSGALIANSLRPFAIGGIGRIQNSRTLCASNASNPSLYVAARPEFLLQLTDFYKTTYKVYKEVNP